MNTRRVRVRREGLPAPEPVNTVSNDDVGQKEAIAHLRERLQEPIHPTYSHAVYYRYRFTIEEDMRRNILLLRADIMRTAGSHRVAEYTINLNITTGVGIRGTVTNSARIHNLANSLYDLVMHALPVVDYFTFMVQLRDFMVIDNPASERIARSLGMSRHDCAEAIRQVENRITPEDLRGRVPEFI